MCSLALHCMCTPKPEGVAAAVAAVPELAEGNIHEDAITRTICIICLALCAKPLSW